MYTISLSSPNLFSPVPSPITHFKVFPRKRCYSHRSSVHPTAPNHQTSTMTFMQHKPELSSDREHLEHPPRMYTTHLEHGDLEGIWSSSFLILFSSPFPSYPFTSKSKRAWNLTNFCAPKHATPNQTFIEKYERKITR